MLPTLGNTVLHFALISIPNLQNIIFCSKQVREQQPRLGEILDMKFNKSVCHNVELEARLARNVKQIF